ncbi:ZIP family zinc transporter [Streptomyces sp. NPDC002769]|uniref:ZIP family metal transporter n=1 Tax=Streptomyces sp. NPDC002769 TaxID=3154542 RepID=UPI003320DE48
MEHDGCSGRRWVGLLAGSALLAGAALGYLVRVPQRVIAYVMAFGAGVLLSAVSFELLDEAHKEAGLVPTAAGTLLGAATYTVGNVWLARRGARHRKRSGHREQQPSEEQQAGSGSALALGALLGGVPESAAIGVSLLGGSGAVSLVTVAAVFISNVPEGLSSSTGMRAAERGARYVFGVWGSIAAASALSALLGYTVIGGMSPAVVATMTAVAAGAVLAMVGDTMIPEAYEETRLALGLIIACGFLVSFGLSHLRPRPGTHL